MSSLDHRQRGTDEGPMGGPGQVPGPNPQQMPFSGSTPIPVGSLQSQPNQFYSAPPGGQPLNSPEAPSRTTNALIDPSALSTINRQLLEEVDTGAIPVVPKNTAGLREPVLIRRTWSKRTGSIRPPRGRRLVIH